MVLQEGRRWNYTNQSQRLYVSPAFTELDKLTKFRSKPDFVALANERLIATLTRNLADMQQAARLDAVSVCVCHPPIPWNHQNGQ